MPRRLHWGAKIGYCSGVAQRQTHCRAIEPDSVAKLSRHDPYAYLKDVLERLTTQRMIGVVELCPFAKGEQA